MPPQGGDDGGNDRGREQLDGVQEGALKRKPETRNPKP